MDVKAKLWLEKDSKVIIGMGRAELLRMVKETGSLSEAAKSMGMAYSHAWSEIKEMSEAAGGQVLETTRGGKDGGRSSLTELGEKILKKFESEKEKLDRHLAKRNR